MQQSFSALGVSAHVVRALERHGITTPFPVQQLVLPDALAGVDVLAASPTGSGKTLAFGIPLVERVANASGRPAALVLVPTRELASQVVADLEPIAAACSLRIAAVYGGASVSAQAKRARSAQILVATPGRLHDLIERGLVSLRSVRVLVLDEADRMLDMGFKPQVDRVLRDVPENRQTLLFSATLEGAVMDLAHRYTVNPVHIHLERPVKQQRADINHTFMSVTADTKVGELDKTIDHAQGLSLVFVRTKHGADRLARRLARDHDLRTAVMHGNMSQNARERSLARFEAGKVSTLVATDVAARGLDVDAITQVINFDPPRTDEDYVHRVGRTGRAGRSGTGVTVVPPRTTHRRRQTCRAPRPQRIVRGATRQFAGTTPSSTAQLSPPNPAASRWLAVVAATLSVRALPPPCDRQWREHLNYPTGQRASGKERRANTWTFRRAPISPASSGVRAVGAHPATTPTTSPGAPSPRAPSVPDV